MIIDGKKIAAEILAEVKAEVEHLPFRPKLIDVLVGADAVTESYVKIKAKRAAEIGIDFEIARIDAEIGQKDLEQKMRELNMMPNLRGLIIQLPLPKHLDKQKIIDQIDSSIDVDMITSLNLGKMFTGNPPFMPATAGSIMRILDSLNMDLATKKVLVIGSGDLVGKPVTFLLMQRNATVTVANEHTQNLAELCNQSDIIISGTGQPKLITKDMFSSKRLSQVVIIDAGTAESAGGIAGDADFESLKGSVAAITPVPGGVGPVTVAMLLYNVLRAAKQQPMPQS